MIERRACGRCGRSKLLREFTRRQGDSLASWCGACRKELGRERGRGHESEEQPPVRLEDVLDKWSDFGTRLVRLRQRHGTEFADFAAGQLAVIEAVIGDLAVVVGKEKGVLVVTFRRKKRFEIDGQLRLWEAA